MAMPPDFYTAPVAKHAPSGLYLSINGEDEPHTVAFATSHFCRGCPGLPGYNYCSDLKSLLDNSNPGYRGSGTDPRCEGLEEKMNVIEWEANKHSVIIGPFSNEDTGQLERLTQKLEDLPVSNTRRSVIYFNKG
jgi:hypothetical protein